MASIRKRGPHTVIVQPRRTERNGRGTTSYVLDGPAVYVKRCSVQSVREWATAEEIYADGLKLLSMRRLFSITWPGDVNALVYFRPSENDAWGEFETVGDPQLMDMSRRTKHWVTTLKWLRDVDEPPIVPPADPPEEVP